jgi:translation initiation factor 6 (eIF-6)
MHTFVCRLGSISLSLLLAVGTARAGGGYVQTNLVVNDQNLVTAQQTDPNLQGTWGLG